MTKGSAEPGGTIGALFELLKDLNMHTILMIASCLALIGAGFVLLSKAIQWMGEDDDEA